MARKRNRKGRVPKHLRKYLFKRKGSKMAKRRKSRKSGVKRRRRSGGGRRVVRRRGRRGSSGGGYSLKPAGEDIKLWAASAAWGFVEGKAKGDASFILNKVPKFVDQLGWTGNTALALWVASYFLKSRWLRLGARAGASITAYQLGRKGGAFGQTGEFFTIAGYSDDDVKEIMDRAVGSLSPEGMPWDEAAQQAMEMVQG